MQLVISKLKCTFNYAFGWGARGSQRGGVADHVLKTRYYTIFIHVPVSLVAIKCSEVVGVEERLEFLTSRGNFTFLDNEKDKK